MRKIDDYKSGFTLVELMVVISVFSILSAIILTTFPKYSSKVAFDNQVLDIALDIRKAQVYGMGVRETDTGSGEFNRSYGVYFENPHPPINNGNGLSYILFADSSSGPSSNGLYDPLSSESIEEIQLRDRFEIEEVCVKENFGPENCAISRLDIIFKRPYPDAIVSPVNSNAIIKIKDKNDETTKKIIVTRTGQIYVE